MNRRDNWVWFTVAVLYGVAAIAFAAYGSTSVERGHWAIPVSLCCTSTVLISLIVRAICREKPHDYWQVSIRALLFIIAVVAVLFAIVRFVAIY